MKKIINIDGMTCTSCQALVYEELSDTKGISDVSVNLEEGFASFDMDEKMLSMDDIEEIISSLGFTIRK